MPPRYAYWTIIAGGLPTAFRATDRGDLMPTFQRLREKHPDAVMKWFARGKLWDSPEDARGDHAGSRDRDRGERRDGDRTDRGGGRGRPDQRDASREPRDRSWRPGGEHRDPRQKFKDAKKARNLDRRQEKFARKHGGARDGREDTRPPREKPHGDARLAPPGRSPNAAREPRFSGRPLPTGPSTAGRDRKGGWQKPGSGFREKPHGDPFRNEIGGSRRSAHEPSRDRRNDQVRGGGNQRDDRGRQPASNGQRKDNWRTPQRDARGDRPPQSGPRDRGGNWGDRPGGSAGPRNDRPRDNAHRDSRGDQWGAKAGNRERRDGWRDRPTTPRERPHGDPLRKDIASSAPRRDDRRDSAPRGDQRFQKPDRPGQRPPTTDWRGRPTAPKGRPHGDPIGHQAKTPRAFAPGGFVRGQGTDEPPAPPRPRGPNREPAPSERPEPAPPPRPSEPSILPPGPPERGRFKNNKPPRPRKDRR